MTLHFFFNVYPPSKLFFNTIHIFISFSHKILIDSFFLIYPLNTCETDLIGHIKVLCNVNNLNACMHA